MEEESVAEDTCINGWRYISHKSKNRQIRFHQIKKLLCIKEWNLCNGGKYLQIMCLLENYCREYRTSTTVQQYQQPDYKLTMNWNSHIFKNIYKWLINKWKDVQHYYRKVEIITTIRYYLITLKMSTIKKLKNKKNPRKQKGLVRIWRNWNPCVQSVGCKIVHCCGKELVVAQKKVI